MSVTRTSKRVALLSLAFVGAFGVGGWPGGGGLDSRGLGQTGGSLGLVTSAVAQTVKFANAQAAYDQGLSAYRSGYYEIAIPAFEFVVARGDRDPRFFAEFYLGRIFADNAANQTDHPKAYMLFQRIADEYADIDPDDTKRAPFVAKALTKVALYVRDGLTEIGLKPDEQRAVEYLRHAATFFNEPDAQFELARLSLAEESQRATGLHFLQKLSKEGHPGAQATFADLMARGRYMKADKTQALGLIKMAVENAPPSERIWIEDIYQSIFCGAEPDVREKSKGVVANWRKMFTLPKAQVEQPMGLGRRAELTPTRICSNGERLDLPREGASQLAPPAAVASPVNPAPMAIVPSGVRDAGRPVR